MKLFSLRTKKAPFRALSDDLWPSTSTQWIDYTLAFSLENFKRNR
jgi:hypothetical protein